MEALQPFQLSPFTVGWYSARVLWPNIIVVGVASYFGYWKSIPESIATGIGVTMAELVIGAKMRWDIPMLAAEPYLPTVYYTKSGSVAR